MIAIQADLRHNSALAKLPTWANRIVERVLKPPPVDFTAKYDDLTKDLPDFGELSKEQECILKMTKVELHRLAERVKASGSLSKAELARLALQVKRSDLLDLASQTFLSLERRSPSSDHTSCRFLFVPRFYAEKE